MTVVTLVTVVTEVTKKSVTPFFFSLKTQIVTKPKTQIVTKLKNYEWLWQHSKIQIVMELKNANCDKTEEKNWDTTQKLTFWQNSKTQIVTKPKNSNCDKTTKLKLWQNPNCEKTKKKINLWQK